MTDPVTRAWFVNADETKRWPVTSWRDLVVDQDEWRQTASLTVRKDSNVVTQALGSTIGCEFYEYQLWVYHRKYDVPLFWGPVLNPQMVDRGYSGSAWVTLNFEGHIQTALRRRMTWTSDDGWAGGLSTAPNTIAINLMDNAMGGVSGPVYPSGYPGAGAGPLRTNFKSVTYAAGSATGSPSTITWKEQPGNNLQDAIEQLCDRYDMCPELTRNSAANYKIGIDYPYEQNDLSGSIVLTALRGTASAFAADWTYEFANVVCIGGAGGGRTQVKIYAQDATSVTARGVHEDQETLNDGASTHLTGDSTWKATLGANPKITYVVRAMETTPCKFNSTYAWRDTVRVYGDYWTHNTAQTIVGFTLRALNGGRRYNVDLKIRAQKQSPLRRMASRTGALANRGTGGRYRDNRGL